jgi:hypothetical protein
MERTKWTDDLLDHRFAAMDEKFELLYSEIRDLREEMQAGFAELRREMAGLRTELLGQMALDRAQVVGVHRLMNVMMGTALVSVVGLLGVLVARL